MSEARRIDRASRRIAAPPEAVFAAQTDPDALVRWLPPQGASMTVDRFEPAPGGTFRYVLHFDGPAGGQGKSTETTDIVEGRFVTLAGPSTIVQEIVFESADPAFAGTMRMAWLVERDGTGSRVTVTAENVPPGITAEDHRQGLDSSLGNLARLLETGG